MPQFQTKSCESDLPKQIFDPQFSETFSALELHPALQFRKGSVSENSHSSRFHICGGASKNVCAHRAGCQPCACLTLCVCVVCVCVCSEWRPRTQTSAGVKCFLHGGQVVALVSIHDMQVHGPDNIIGFTFISLRPGGGVSDNWHPLYAGPAHIAASAREGSPPVDPRQRQPLFGHMGAPSSINVRTSYE